MLDLVVCSREQFNFQTCLESGDGSETFSNRLCFIVQVSPTYYLLTAVAVTDLLTMLAYLPYAVYFYCVATPEPEYQHRLLIIN